MKIKLLIFYEHKMFYIFWNFKCQEEKETKRYETQIRLNANELLCDFHFNSTFHSRRNFIKEMTLNVGASLHNRWWKPTCRHVSYIFLKIHYLTSQTEISPFAFFKKSHFLQSENEKKKKKFKLSISDFFFFITKRFNFKDETLKNL